MVSRPFFKDGGRVESVSSSVISIRSSAMSVLRLGVSCPQEMSEVGAPWAAGGDDVRPIACRSRFGELGHGLLHSEVGAEEDIGISECAHPDVPVAPRSDPRQGEQIPARRFPIAAGAEVEAPLGQGCREGVDRADARGRKRPVVGGDRGNRLGCGEESIDTVGPQLLGKGLPAPATSR